MNELVTVNNITLKEIGTNPDAYQEEVVCAALDTMQNVERTLKFFKQNIIANIHRRMQQNNATKIIFINEKREKKTATLKAATPKLNPVIRNPEEYIRLSGFEPGQLGEYKYTPYSWGKIKEIRKLGGELQVLCDELYAPGQPGIDIK